MMFYVILFLITSCIVALTIYNAYTFNKIASKPNQFKSLTQGEARLMFWFNVVFGFFALSLWLYSLIVLFGTPTQSSFTDIKSEVFRQKLLKKGVDFESLMAY